MILFKRVGNMIEGDFWSEADALSDGQALIRFDEKVVYKVGGTLYCLEKGEYTLDKNGDVVLEHQRSLKD